LFALERISATSIAFLDSLIFSSINFFVASVADCIVSVTFFAVIATTLNSSFNFEKPLVASFNASSKSPLKTFFNALPINPID